MPKPAAASPSLNINLLPQETIEVEKNSLLRWVLTIGRYLVIFTEVVAIGTFVFSIYLSTQKNNLRDSISQSEQQVRAFQSCDTTDKTAFCEDRFLRIQSQVNQISALRASQVQQNEVIAELFKLLPTNLKLKTLTIDGVNLSFSGTFPAEQQLQTLVDSFNKSEKITQLDLTSLTKGTIFEFTATAYINQVYFTGVK